MENIYNTGNGIITFFSLLKTNKSDTWQRDRPFQYASRPLTLTHWRRYREMLHYPGQDLSSWQLVVQTATLMAQLFNFAACL